MEPNNWGRKCQCSIRRSARLRGLLLICVLYQELLTKISFGENPDRFIEKHRQKIFNWTKRRLRGNVKVWLHAGADLDARWHFCKGGISRLASRHKFNAWLVLTGRRASVLFRLRAFFDCVKSQTHAAARGLTPASFFLCRKKKKPTKKNIGSFGKERTECALRRSCSAHISRAPPVW